MKSKAELISLIRERAVARYRDSKSAGTPGGEPIKFYSGTKIVVSRAPEANSQEPIPDKTSTLDPKDDLWKEF